MRYNIQTKVLTGFILGLMAIGLIGYEVHNQMSELALSLFQKNNRQNNLVTYQKLLSTISDAESSVRTFSITSKENDLRLFYSAQSNLNHYLSTLQTAIGNNKEFKSLHQNVTYKLHLLNRMIDLKKKHPTDNILQEALNEISRLEQSRKLERAQSEALKQQIASQEISEADSLENHLSDESDKKSFFQRIFGDNDDEEVDRITASEEESLAVEKPASVPTVPETTKTNDIQDDESSIANSIRKLQQERTAETELWEQAMLILIQEDSRIMEDIRKNMLALEKEELDTHSTFVAVAAKSKNQIISNTKMVAIGAFSIIFILSIIVINDFNELRKNRQSLIDEKDKATHLAKVKEEFLASMSHEIRTPMNAIIGYSELLEKTPLNKDQHGFLATIQQSSSHLLVILNDILDFSKLESGKLKINKEPFQPLKSIDQVVKSMAYEANKKGIDLNVKVKEPLQKNVMGDMIRFQQILYNLVSNAIKFTDQGAVNIKVEGEKTGNKYNLRMEVEDQGIGISPAYLDKIFEDFEQASSGRERQYGGTGLGLSIVKRLVDLQHGSIEVESEENKGSTFIVVIPYEITDEIEQTHKKNIEDASSEPNLNGLRILAIDDQEYNLELINLILQKWGAKVDLASSGAKGIELFNANDYDIILMDVQMPGMSGLEATKKIRNNEIKNGKNIPIVALTAASTKEETDRCIQAGMNSYLLKPFRQKQLKATISEQIQDKMNPFKPKTSNDNNNKITYNLEPLREVSNGNGSFVKNMLDVFIKNTTHDLKQLEKFAEEKNWKSVGYKAHKMVSPTKHLGITPLAELLEEIEVKGINETDIENLPTLINETKRVAIAATYMLEQEMLKINNEIKQAS